MVRSRMRRRHHTRTTTLVAGFAESIPVATMRTAAFTMRTPHHARPQMNAMRGMGRRRRRHIGHGDISREERSGKRHHGENLLDLHEVHSLLVSAYARPANLRIVARAVVRFFSRSFLSPQPHSQETPPR